METRTTMIRFGKAAQAFVRGVTVASAYGQTVAIDEEGEARLADLNAHGEF